MTTNTTIHTNGAPASIPAPVKPNPSTPASGIKLSEILAQNQSQAQMVSAQGETINKLLADLETLKKGVPRLDAAVPATPASKPALASKRKASTTASAAPSDLLAQLEAAKAENAALKSAAARLLTLKVSAKGALSVYGLGRFPVSLYREQWEKLLDSAPEVKAFILTHGAELKTRN